MAYKKRDRPDRERKLYLETEAFRLRVEGYAMRGIAEALGLKSPATAWRHYVNGRERYREQHERSTEAHLAVELARLDEQVRALWPLAMGHKETRIVDETAVEVDVSPDIEAHHALLGINKARRAMLGLDVPKEVSIKAHTVETATMIWGFDLETTFPDPPPVPQLEHANGDDQPQAASAANGAQGPNGSDSDP